MTRNSDQQRRKCRYLFMVPRTNPSSSSSRRSADPRAGFEAQKAPEPSIQRAGLYKEGLHTEGRLGGPRILDQDRGAHLHRGPPFIYTERPPLIYTERPPLTITERLSLICTEGRLSPSQSGRPSPTQRAVSQLLPPLGSRQSGADPGGARDAQGMGLGSGQRKGRRLGSGQRKGGNGPWRSGTCSGQTSAPGEGPCRQLLMYGPKAIDPKLNLVRRRE